MQKIVTDVTYIKHNGKWYYLAGYLDLFNNEIVEWELSDTFDNFLVMRPAERLLKRKMSTEHQVLLHSDQGVQYSSAGYCNLLKKYNVIQKYVKSWNPSRQRSYGKLLGAVQGHATQALPLLGE